MRIRLVFALALTSLLVLSGCNDSGNGDDGDATGSGSASGTHTGSASGSGSGTGTAPVELEGEVSIHGDVDLRDAEELTLEMELDDFYFEPTFIRADADDQVTLELHNEGAAPHTFTVDGQEIDVEVAAGEEASVEVRVTGGEAVTFYCRFHKQQGMQGAFYTG